MPRTYFRTALTAAVLLFGPSLAYGQQARVEKVIDGDTFVACSPKCETVRIANIDAPEMPPKAECNREPAYPKVRFKPPHYGMDCWLVDIGGLEWVCAVRS